MRSTSSQLPLPPLVHNEHGEVRRVGVEMEMGGIDIDELSDLVARHVNGEVERVSNFEYKVRGDPAGSWTVELDFDLLKRFGRQPQNPDSVFAELEDAVDELLRVGAGMIVPMEVVSPPLPMNRLNEINELIFELRRAGAKGTRELLHYAFGVHLNPEVPSCEATMILGYLQSFLCLHDWLKARADPDLTRRITPYIDPFPIAYLRLVIDSAYKPDIVELIDDYLDYNPTRNRGLDMLPLFAYIDAERVGRRVNDVRVKGRPTLHYRLPNCEIDREDWSIHDAWVDWLMVERVLAHPERLQDLMQRYARYLEQPVARLFDSWSSQVDSWLYGQDNL